MTPFDAVIFGALCELKNGKCAPMLSNTPRESLTSDILLPPYSCELLLGCMSENLFAFRDARKALKRSKYGDRLDL